MSTTMASEVREKTVPLCARCHVAEVALVVRTEHLCRECFMKYVATKILKRMETNKLRASFKDRPKTLLVPVSFGVSSIVLLHVLDQQLSNRAEAGRHAGYNLHILHVDQSAVFGQASLYDLFDVLKQRYPSHVYTVVSLEDYYDYGVKFDLPASADALTNGHNVIDKRARLKHILSSFSSATSRADMLEVLRRRLIIAFAQAHACENILFGDSTTRLAEKTLSETAKGRGVALPWLTADGQSSDGINRIYPLRDLLRKELGAYISMTLPPLTPLIHVAPSQMPTSSKDNTIDNLMTQYFESVEQNYPSIVANVVRTSGRLVAPPISEGNDTCAVCGCPIVDDSRCWDQLGSAIPQSADGNGSEKGEAICYGCARSI